MWPCRLANMRKIMPMAFVPIVGGCTFTGWMAIVAAIRMNTGVAWIEKQKSGKRPGKPGFFRALYAIFNRPGRIIARLKR